MTENDKKKDYQEKLDEYPEIKEALEAMQRASVVEEKEAKDLFELLPSYFPIKPFR